MQRIRAVKCTLGRIVENGERQGVDRACDQRSGDCGRAPGLGEAVRALTSSPDPVPMARLPVVVAAPLTTNSASELEPARLGAPVLSNPVAVTFVAALRPELPMSNVPSLVRIPPKVAVLEDQAREKEIQGLSFRDSSFFKGFESQEFGRGP
jgi:hypothetical protein